MDRLWCVQHRSRAHFGLAAMAAYVLVYECKSPLYDGRRPGSVNIMLQKREQRCEPTELFLGHPSHIPRHCADPAHGTHICGDLLWLLLILGEPHV